MSAIDAAMDRYAAGDDAAFAIVYDGLSSRLFGFLLRQTRSRQRAEDLLQQTFLQMHSARGRFVRGAEVTPWAFAIARRLVIDSYRRRRREVVDGDRVEVESAKRDTGHAADADYEAREMAERMQKELERLPPAQREAFELIKQEGLSLAEAADVLGTTVTAVKLRAHRAYQSLRRALGEPGEESS